MEDDSHNAAPLPAWQRPINEQVSAIRHDTESLKQQQFLMFEAINRLTHRVEIIETGQVAMGQQIAAMALTPEAIEEKVEAGIARHDQRKRAEEERLRGEREAAIEAREDRRWKRIQRYMMVAGAVALLTPYILFFLSGYL